MSYIHQLPGWPALRWDEGALAARLSPVRLRQGRLLGRMDDLGFQSREEARLRSLTEEVVETSEIEGETLVGAQVRSSIARRLGLDVGGLVPSDRRVDGVVDVVLDAARNYEQPLTEERLFAWQASLFPTSWSGLRKITVGAWRNGPVDVVSGPEGRPTIHFEAPGAGRLAHEMRVFLAWFEHGPAMDPVLKAAVAHFWFVTIHPFDDGNGRIARAIADMSLARSEQSPRRFYSMSAQIRRERNAYYESLEEAQKGGLDITTHLIWFVDCLGRAFDHAEETLASVLAKARFWKALADQPVNDRQRAMLDRLFDGFDGFDGKLTSSKWAKLAKCSQDTAARDLAELAARGILKKDPAGGRSTNYSLIVPSDERGDAGED